MTAESTFWELARELMEEDPRVVDGTMMKGRCLRVGKEFLALSDFKSSGLVVKLSKARVAELIGAGIGRPFAPAGRVFVEWVSLPEVDRARWASLLREGVALAAGETDLTIRFGRLSERGDLEAIQRRASFVWKEYRAPLRAHPDAIEVPAAQLRARGVRVAEIRGRRVGFAAVVSTRRPGIVELDGLFVEPDVMGVGVGRRLMEDVIRLARRRGARVMMVTAGPARGFYEKVGFRVVRETPTRFGPAVRMRGSLT